MAKFSERLKTLGLMIIFIVLLFLAFYIPQNRSFNINIFKTANLLNLGRIFHISLTPSGVLKTDSDGWTNILILGKAGKDNPAPDLTDSIILASLRNNQVIFLSIPRDLYVKIDGNYQKINSLWASIHDAQKIKELAIRISGREIHYFVLVDLELLKNIAEQLDGVNVLVKEDINDSLFPGANYSYSPFILSKGWRHLDGDTLLKYVRTRYDSEGDFGRMKRQQQVLAALKNKIENLNTFQNFDFILSLYNAFKEHIKTDLSLSEIKAFWEATRKLDLTASKAFNLSIKDPAILKEDYIATYQGRMFVLIPDGGLDNYNKINEYVNQIYENYQ